MTQIEIYQDPETEEYDVAGEGECPHIFDKEVFSGDNAAVDAFAFAEDWQDEAKKEGIICEIVWINDKPGWAA